MTPHICVSKPDHIIGSDNGLSPGRRQAIIWTDADILSTGHLGINFSEILMEIQTLSFTKMRLRMSSAKWQPSSLGLNVLRHIEAMWRLYALLNWDIVGSCNGLTPARGKIRVIWLKIRLFSFKKNGHLKQLPEDWPFRLGLNALNPYHRCFWTI